MRVTPVQGSLAPRGGAANACDGGKTTYSDTVRLTVYSPEEGTRERGAGDEADRGSGRKGEEGRGESGLHLVVRTECDYWSWLIECD